MKIYLNNNVFEAALDRIRWVYDEFPEVICNVSGGKDSTVVFELCKIVAREKGRLPLKTLFVDQEAEWQATIDMVEYMMNDPDVEPMWYQIPFKLFNATSTEEHWLQCWDPKDEDRWMRPKWHKAITENNYGEDRFTKVFEAILRDDFKGQKVAHIGGVRAEESPNRALGLTANHTYKGETWGKHYKGRDHYVMYPIWNWSYYDIWAAIHKNGWKYNTVYDAQYAYGIPVMQMRVSNVHHETAVMSLFYMQEVEPETYQKLTQRIKGIDTAGKMNFADYFPRTLPYMFKDWEEYRDYLLEKLILDPDWKKAFKKNFKVLDFVIAVPEFRDKAMKVMITSIMTNDWEGIKMVSYRNSPKIYQLARDLGLRK